MHSADCTGLLVIPDPSTEALHARARRDAAWSRYVPKLRDYSIAARGSCERRSSGHRAAMAVSRPDAYVQQDAQISRNLRTFAVKSGAQCDLDHDGVSRTTRMVIGERPTLCKVWVYTVSLVVRCP